MSETVSQLPTTATPLRLADGIVVAGGYSGPLSGATYLYTLGKVLGANSLIYAGDPAYGGGVKADGSTDDTTAWVAALGAAFNSASWVVAPNGVSVVSTLNVPNGVGVIGQTPSSWIGGLGSTVTGSVIKGTSTSAPSVTLGTFSRLRDIQIVGNGTQPCVNVSGGYVCLEFVTISAGSVGVSFAVAGGLSRLVSCRIHDCATAGVLNAVDTEIADCRIGLCGHGVSLGAGSNSVRVIGGKIEQCTGSAIKADAGIGSIAGLLVSAVELDASSQASLLLRGISSSTVTGCTLSRGGQAQAGTPSTANDTNLYMQNCRGVTLVGNTSRTGNAGAGYVGPYWAVYDGGGNVNCIIAVNYFTYHNNSGSGGAAGPINSTSTFNLASGLNQTPWS